jgi:hypothetical protein
MTMENSRVARYVPAAYRQRGVTTLAITLLLLGIVTIIVLFSTNVAFFEQRTTTNQSRAVSTEQIAEYALNLGGQYLNANRAVVVNATAPGWLSSGASRRWVRCPAGALANEGGPVAMTHPCASERIQSRREAMYYYDNDPSTTAIEPIPYSSITNSSSVSVTGALTGADATSRFGGTTTVNALLCRIGYTSAGAPECQASPATGSNIAISMIARSQLTNESAQATVKETWATAITIIPNAPAPLIASGLVEGLGNAQIVASPNAGGYGVAASIWAPSNVDIGSTGVCGSGGVGSVSTCHLGEYLQGTPRENLKTTCATSNNACGCPAISASGVDFLSGHSQSVRKENLDILDMDGNCGALPDITFFPKEPYDNPNDPTDDSMFEYIFDVDYVVNEGSTAVNQNCGQGGNENCATYALTTEYGATVLPDCSSLNASSTGIYYVTGDCDLNSAGSPASSIIVVVDGDLTLNGNIDFYGMLFVRSDDNSAEVRGNGNVKIFGSFVIEGNVDVTGSIDLIYDATAVAGNPNGPLPPSARFGKVSGSWLDSSVGI